MAETVDPASGLIPPDESDALGQRAGSDGPVFPKVVAV